VYVTVASGPGGVAVNITRRDAVVISAVHAAMMRRQIDAAADTETI